MFHVKCNVVFSLLFIRFGCFCIRVLTKTRICSAMLKRIVMFFPHSSCSSYSIDFCHEFKEGSRFEFYVSLAGWGSFEASNSFSVSLKLVHGVNKLEDNLEHFPDS